MGREDSREFVMMRATASPVVSRWAGIACCLLGRRNCNRTTAIEGYKRGRTQTEQSAAVVRAGSVEKSEEMGVVVGRSPVLSLPYSCAFQRAQIGKGRRE